MLAGKRYLPGVKAVRVSAILEQAGWDAIKAGQGGRRDRCVSRGDQARSEERDAVARRRHGGIHRASRSRSQGVPRTGARSRSEADARARAAGAGRTSARAICRKRFASTKSSPAKCRTMRACATRSIAGSASAICTSACGSRSAITSPSRSKARRMRRWRRKRSNRSNSAFWRICDVFGAFPPKSIPVVLYSGEQFRDITRSPQVGRGGVRRHHSRADARRRREGRGSRSRARARVLARADSIDGDARPADLAERRTGVRARERRPRLGGERAVEKRRSVPSLERCRRRSAS